jgi:hypothetical protein
MTRFCLTCLAALLAGCAAAEPPEPMAAAPAPPAAAPAPVVQTMPAMPGVDSTDVLRAALGTWPQCRAEILGFVGLASLARELGPEGDVFADAIDDLSGRVAECIQQDDDDGLLRS